MILDALPAFRGPFPRRFPRPSAPAAGLAALILAAALFFTTGVRAAEQTAEVNMPTVRVGTLKFGTVNWGIDVIKHHGLAEKEGVRMEVVPLASKNAAAVALQGGAVDVIVTDWFWVSRQRSQGRDYTFSPYSVIAGGLMVRPDSGIDGIADLRNRKIGVAGGQVDKSWLLLRAYGLENLDADLAAVAEPVYGAPPLLNRLIEKGDLPAVLTFWHYQARLKAKGMKQAISISEVLEALGVAPGVPIIGWVFSEEWAGKNLPAIKGFLRASAAAGRILVESDAEWARLEDLIKPDDEATLIALRNAYREGIPEGFGAEDIDSAAKLFRLLARIGGTELVGKSKEMAPGTFWTGATD